MMKIFVLSDFAVAFSAFEEQAEAAAHNVKSSPLWEIDVFFTSVAQLQQKNKQKKRNPQIPHPPCSLRPGTPLLNTRAYPKGTRTAGAAAARQVMHVF